MDLMDTTVPTSDEPLLSTIELRDFTDVESLPPIDPEEYRGPEFPVYHIAGEAVQPGDVIEVEAVGGATIRMVVVALRSRKYVCWRLEMGGYLLREYRELLDRARGKHFAVYDDPFGLRTRQVQQDAETPEQSE